MADETQTADYQPDPNGQSGSMGIDQAAAALTKLDAPARQPTGQFAPKEQPDTEKVVDIKTAKPVGADKPADKAAIGHNGGPELDDDFFEFAPEKEGEEPRRVKADEVFQAYEELPRLKAELEKTRTSGPPPQQYIEQVRELATARKQYVDGLALVQRMHVPTEPDARLSNPNDPNYDPDAYAREMNTYRRDAAAYRERQQHLAEQWDQQQADQAALVRLEQERAEPGILEMWPDLKDTTKRKAILQHAVQATGFTLEEIRASHDPRAWRVLKGFLENEANKSKQAEAAKVVRAKPKLVKGAARSGNTQADSLSAAKSKLASSGSMEDAAAALTLLG
jgi:hypothetical protein